LAQLNNFSIFGYAGGFWVARNPQAQDMEAATLAAPRVIASGGTAGQAAASAQKEFRLLAQSLYNRNAPGDRLVAQFALINSQIASWWK